MGNRVAVLGASGYAGGELVRLVDDHPAFDVAYLGAHSRAGEELGAVHPHLTGPRRKLGPNDLEEFEGADLVFLALPHGASAEIGVALADLGTRVIDLGSDFRLDTAERYAEAYGGPHPHPDRLASWAYGLPELFAVDVAAADTVAAPGCYPTAALLALAPVVSAGLVDPDGIVVDALSGVSGAGRSLREDLLFGAVDESVRAYAVGVHRHRPEIEMALEAHAGAEVSVTFTPHLVPMQRGILATCTARPLAGVGVEDLRDALNAAYDGKPFVEVGERPPETRWVTGSNRAVIVPALDRHAGSVIVISVIDNLVKGAAGQAVQCANLMFGFDEALGLPRAGGLP